MKGRFLIALMLIANLPTAQAQALEGGYIGTDYLFLSYKEPGLQSLDPGAVGIRFGTDLNEFFGFEGRVGYGANSDALTLMGVTVDMEIDNFYGAYGKLFWEAVDGFWIYNTFGFSRGKATFSGPGVTLSESDNGFSYGFGLEFRTSDALMVGAEWMRFLDESTYRLDGVSVGMRWYFGR